MPPPFAFVEDDPAPGSPAEGAGFLAGDAILRFGNASSLDALPRQLIPGRALTVAVVEAATGKTAKRIVVPHAYDARHPTQLLGFQIVDQCPVKFMPHPAVEDDWEREALPPPPPPAPSAPTASHPPAPAPSATQLPQGLGRGRGRGRASSTPAHAVPDVNASNDEYDPFDRILPTRLESEELAQAKDEERFHDNGSQGEEEDDSVGDDLAEKALDEEAGSTCSSGASQEDSHGRGSAGKRRPRQTLSLDHDHGDPSSPQVLACCRFALLTSSVGILGIVALLAAGPSTLASDQQAIQAVAIEKYSTQHPGDIVPTFKQDLVRLASIQCDASPLPPPPPTLEIALATTTATSEAFAPAAAAAASAAAQGEAAGAMSWNDTVTRRLLYGSASDSVLSGRSFVRGIVAAVSLQLVLCVTGLGLALVPSTAAPRLRGVLVCIYAPAAVALWLLLAAATMYCVVFRLEATALVHHYWSCLEPSLTAQALQQLEHSRLYSDTTAAAALCAAGDVLTVVGLFAVCTLIGWRLVLRAGVMLVSGLSAAIGAALLAAGLLLRIDDAVAHGGEATRAVGSAVLLASLLGLYSAHRERLLLLQIYAVLQCACAAVVLTVLGVLFFSGIDGLLGRTAAATTGLRDSLTARELAELLQEHRLATSAASVLLLLLLFANVVMVVALRWLIGARRHRYDAVDVHVEDRYGGDGEDVDSYDR